LPYAYGVGLRLSPYAVAALPIGGATTGKCRQEIPCHPNDQPEEKTREHGATRGLDFDGIGVNRLDLLGARSVVSTRSGPRARPHNQAPGALKGCGPLRTRPCSAIAKGVHCGATYSSSAA
jgi:hypothetical protein